MAAIWLPIAELEVGHLYRLEARRQRFGVWDGSVFIGVQWEFGSPTLSHESHWDAGGSAKPLEDVAECPPPGVRLRPGWSPCEVCGEETTFNRQAGRHEHIQPTDHDAQVERWMLNTPLLEWLLKFEPSDDSTT